jgi:hypothetical protein
MMIGMKSRLHFFSGLCISYLLLACRPVLVIGWGEFFFLVVVIAVLIGPPLYRLIRKIENSHREKNK